MVDRRREGLQFPVAAISFEQGVWAAAESTALEKTLSNLTGTVYAVEVVVSDTTNSITMTVAIVSANGVSLFSESSISDDDSTWFDAQSSKATPDADFNPIPVVGDLVATLTPSGVPGSGGATIDVILYMR